MVYAVIRDGVVVNIVSSYTAMGSNWQAVPVNCPVAIGDTYRDGCFYSPEGEMRMSPETAALAMAFDALMGGVADA